MEIEEMMKEISKKDYPSVIEVRKYIRYLINVKKMDEDEIFANVSHWNKDVVENAIKLTKRENAKPKPKRYYVSLKEPLEDARLK